MGADSPIHNLSHLLIPYYILLTFVHLILGPIECCAGDVVFIKKIIIIWRRYEQFHITYSYVHQLKSESNGDA